MYQVRVSGPSLFGGGGTQYLVPASKRHASKYRLAKSRRAMAARFASRKTAQEWARRVSGTVVAV